MNLILAYRQNGSLVGAITSFDFTNSIANVPEDSTPEDLFEARCIRVFGDLAAPPVGQVNMRPVIVAQAFAVPDDLANDSVELIHTVGGTDTGFKVAADLTQYSDFDAEKEPLNIQVERNQAPAIDTPYNDADGNYVCPVCAEINCGWLAQEIQQRREPRQRATIADILRG